MCRWRAIAVTIAVAIAGSTTANRVAAESFEERWSPAPQTQTPTQHWLTRVRVTDIKTGRSVDVIVTDRGPHSRGRVLDLSLGAAKVLGIENRRVVSVRVEVISG